MICIIWKLKAEENFIQHSHGKSKNKMSNTNFSRKFQYLEVNNLLKKLNIIWKDDLNQNI